MTAHRIKPPQEHRSNPLAGIGGPFEPWVLGQDKAEDEPLERITMCGFTRWHLAALELTL